MFRPPYRMPLTLHRLCPLAVAASLLLSACGGGDDTQVAGVSSGGTGSVGPGKSTAVSGTVQALGLRVNGIHIDVTQDTTITDLDGQPVSADQLTAGTSVVVDAGVATQQADGLHAPAQAIQVRPVLLGPVKALPTLAQPATLTVMDQTVALAGGAAIDAHWGSLSAIQVGDVVEVHGWQDVARNVYVATRLVWRASASAYSVTGLLTNLDLDLGQCTVGNQSLGYVSSQSTTALADGMWVRGQLQPRQPDANTGRWFTQAMDPIDNSLPDKQQMSVEGLVSRINLSERWLEVQGWRVDLASPSCTTCSGHTLGDAVRVVGEFKSGLITAREVTPRP